MAGNVIFRGPIERQPRTVNKEVSGAYVPGTFVEDTGSALTQITTAIAKRPLILANNDMVGQDAVTAYTSGDTGVAYELEPGQVYQASLAAATYAANAPLTIAASGRLAAATSGTKVVAFFNDTAGAYAAGALADVVIADGYIVPA
jgi:hypothetical protein